jgi:hypothetical protein
MIPIPPSIATYLRIAAGIAFLALLAWALRLDHLRAGHKAAHEQTKRDYAAAQVEAQARFDRQVAAIIAKNRSANDVADKKDADLRIVYRDRVVRLRPASASCPASGAQLPSPDVPESDHGSGGDSVILERADALICATNTARLQAAQEWVNSLAR